MLLERMVDEIFDEIGAGGSEAGPSLTPTLDEIAAKGNRGHHGDIPNNRITCGDGTVISVVA